MENKSYEQVIGSPNAPYINGLARTYALSAQYYGVTHPSLPNYLSMISGSNQGIVNDCDDCSVSGRSLADQLEDKHLTWGAYIEGIPAPCFNGPSSGTYARRHNPWIYFTTISQDPVRCQRVVPLERLNADLQSGQLPNLVWITPNLIHDMHDGSVRQGDDWLAAFLPTILDSSAWKDGGVLFLLWDEGVEEDSAGCCGTPGGGRTPALVISPDARPDYTSEVHYNHYSFLKTVESVWNLGYLKHAADSETSAMTDLFRRDLTTSR
jgi:phosphatidylinositol-3-phosphatase